MPQAIRSDEWRVSTPLTVLQSKTDFPTFNKDLGSGHDVTLSQDAPIRNWVAIFRPQNFSFFILPLEFAFAFRWWLVMFLLLMATYFFILRILPGKRLIAAVLSTGFALSPYFLWWYQAPVYLPFAYALFSMIIGMRIINQERMPGIKSKYLTNAIYTAALVYLGVSFGLLIYAPFLIPAAIIAVAFLTGYLIDKAISDKLTKEGVVKRLAIFVSSVLIIAAIGLLTITQHRDVIDRMAHSAYPGGRITTSGELAYSHLFPYFGGFLQPLLQSTSRGTHYFANQSEASNFILLLPFLVLPGVLLQIYEYKKRRRISFTFLFLQLVAILLLVRITLPVGDFFYKFWLFDRVPNTRLIAAIGFVGFLQMILLLKHLTEIKLSQRRRYATAIFYGVVAFAILFLFGLHVMHRYPMFLSNYLLLIGFAGLFTAIIVAFLANRLLLGSLLLLFFTIGSSFRIMPLYHGLHFFTDSTIISKMETISKPQDKWVVLDNEKFESMPIVAGRGNIGGHQMYADLNLWHQLDKDHRYENVYNRQGHALFLSNTLPPQPKKRFNVTSVKEDFELVKLNLFKIKFSCSEFTYKNIQFALATHEIDKSCLRLTDTIRYPKISFYIYKVVQPAALQSDHFSAL